MSDVVPVVSLVFAESVGYRVINVREWVKRQMAIADYRVIIVKEGRLPLPI